MTIDSSSENLFELVDAANEANNETLKVATGLCDAGGVDGSTCRALLDAIGATANAIETIDETSRLLLQKPYMARTIVFLDENNLPMQSVILPSSMDKGFSYGRA